MSTSAFPAWPRPATGLNIPRLQQRAIGGMTVKSTSRRKRAEEGAMRATAERRTTGGPRAISRMLDTLIARSGRKRGFGEAALLVQWPAIAGAELAARTSPDKLVRRRGRPAASLHLRVAHGWALEVQHMTPTIIERINGFFGYRAVDDIRIVQGLRENRPAPRRLPRPPRVRPRVSETLDDIVSQIDDPEVAEALRDLAEAVRAQAPPPSRGAESA